MIKDWPTMQSLHGTRIKEKLSEFCDKMEANEFPSTQAKIDALVEILKHATDNKMVVYSDLNNTERKHELYLLTQIVNSIYAYFHSSEIVYKVSPAVFAETMEFWSHRNHSRTKEQLLNSRGVTAHDEQ